MKRLICVLMCLLIFCQAALAEVEFTAPPLTRDDIGYTSEDIEASMGCWSESDDGLWIYLIGSPVYYLRYDAAGSLCEYSIWVDDTTNATFDGSGNITDMSYWGAGDGIMYLWTADDGWQGYVMNDETGRYEISPDAAEITIDPMAVDPLMDGTK